MKSRSLAAFAVSIAAPVVLISAALTTRPLPAAENQPSPGVAAGAEDATQYKSLYAEKCSACHNLHKPEEEGKTRGEWRRTVTRMYNKPRSGFTAAEGAHIVDYLATFAPKPGAGANTPWGADRNDVWGIAPSATHVLNFEGTAAMAHVAPIGSGVPAKWRVISDSQSPDGNAIQVSQLGAKPTKFAMLAAQGASGRDLDIRVRFKIVNGKASPAVGVAFGVQDPDHYSVLRYDQAHNDLALILINGPVHTTLQKTSLDAVLAAPAAPGAPPAPAPAAPVVVAPNQWHTLRVSVKDGQVRGWIDMNKRLGVQDDSYKGGKIALWSQGDTIASFDDWTIDIYDSAVIAKPAS